MLRLRLILLIEIYILRRIIDGLTPFVDSHDANLHALATVSPPRLSGTGIHYSLRLLT